MAWANSSRSESNFSSKIIQVLLMSEPWEMLCHTLKVNRRPIIPKLYMEKLNYALLINIL